MVKCMINKKVLLYIRNEDILKKFKSEDNKSNLFNTLLEDYYSQDLLYLQQKKQELSEQSKVINMKILHKEKQIELIKQHEKEQYEKEKQVRDIKNFNNSLVLVWRNDKITDDDYYAICDIDDLKNKEKELQKCLQKKEVKDGNE